MHATRNIYVPFKKKNEVQSTSSLCYLYWNVIPFDIWSWGVPPSASTQGPIQVEGNHDNFQREGLGGVRIDIWFCGINKLLPQTTWAHLTMFLRVAPV